MAKFPPWKQRFSTTLTNDVESASVVVNVQTRASEDTGGKRAGGSLTLSRCMKLGFILGALSVAIIVGIRLGHSHQNSTQFSQRDHGLENDASRIIGGIEAQILRYQYAVSLQNMSTGSRICGGSLIAPDIVLTAAHCQGDFNTAVIGRHNLSSSEGESIPIKMAFSHAEYNDTTEDNDLMLVLLEWPTTLDLPFVKVNTDVDRPRVGESVTAIGWGDMTIDYVTEITPDVLMSVDIHVISNEACANSSGIYVVQANISGTILTYTVNASYSMRITDNMLCAADIGQDSCQGDSGGPLVIQGSNGDGTDDVLVGVVSWGEGCGLPDFPGVYARISPLYAWINNVVCSQSSNPPVDFVCGGISNTPSPMPTEDTAVDDTISDDGTSISISMSMSMAVTDEFPFFVTDGFEFIGGDGRLATDVYLATDEIYSVDDYVF
ncbi:hypothetical protein ACHAW6_002358 [Cyclotella cf. meneghiniana]